MDAHLPSAPSHRTWSRRTRFTARRSPSRELLLVGVKSATVLSTALAASMLASPALAQDSAFDGEFSVQRFNPAPGPRNFITTRGNRQDGKMAWSAGFVASYAYEPFVVESCISETNCDDENATNPEDVPVVENLATADVMGSLTVIPELQLGLRVPVTYSDGQGLTEEGLGKEDGLSAVGLGDIELEGKYRFYGAATDPITAGAGLFVTAPLGTTTAGEAYIGDELPTFGVRAIGDFKFGPATVGANLVGVWRKKGRVGSTELGPELRYNVGARYAVSPVIDVLVDGFGSTGFSAENGTNALEALLGFGVGPAKGPFRITGGAGTGVLRGVGVPTFRGYVGFIWVDEPVDGDLDQINDSSDQCPTVPEDIDGFEDTDGCPDLDNDDDGIQDATDKCPSAAEDMDEFEDKDGCPESDNDKDGVPDVGDACPGEAETKNGFKDTDGCPDEPDADEDGVPDTKDKCPGEKEDTDGFQDTDGCPEADNDQDGIPDGEDECVDEPETVNEFEDGDGCPDKAPE